MTDRDKRLNEAMGECLCQEFKPMQINIITKRGKRKVTEQFCVKCNNIIHDRNHLKDFSTGDGFMILWEWATHSNERWNTGDKYGDFWIAFCKVNRGSYINGFMTIRRGLIHPNRFADALDEFLHGVNHE